MTPVRAYPSGSIAAEMPAVTGTVGSSSMFCATVARSVTCSRGYVTIWKVRWWQRSC